MFNDEMMMNDSDSDDYIPKLHPDTSLARHYSIQIQPHRLGAEDISVPDFHNEEVMSADDADGRKVNDP